MTVIAINAAAATQAPAVDTSTCFGMACPLRRTCLRYTAIDRMPGEITVQASCFDDGTYPGYLYALDPTHTTGTLLRNPAAEDGLLPC